MLLADLIAGDDLLGVALGVGVLAVLCGLLGLLWGAVSGALRPPVGASRTRGALIGARSDLLGGLWAPIGFIIVLAILTFGTYPGLLLDALGLD